MAPPVHGRAAVAAVYVDNIVIFGADLDSVERLFRRVLRAVDALGLCLHEIEEPSAEVGPFEVVGWVVDAAEGPSGRRSQGHGGFIGAFLA